MRAAAAARAPPAHIARGPLRRADVRTGGSSRRALVRAVREAGGELYVWTVDDARAHPPLEALGVTGVITNDPRLFAQLPSAQVAAE